MDSLPIDSSIVVMLVAALLLAALNRKAVHFPWAITAAFVVLDAVEYLQWILGAVITYHGIELAIQGPGYVRGVIDSHRTDRAIRLARKRARRDEEERQEHWRRHLEELQRRQRDESSHGHEPAETPEQKLERLCREIDESMLPPEVKLSLQAKAKKAYEDESSSKFKW